jgi:hypothetical protein
MGLKSMKCIKILSLGSVIFIILNFNFFFPLSLNTSSLSISPPVYEKKLFEEHMNFWNYDYNTKSAIISHLYQKYNDGEQLSGFTKLSLNNHISIQTNELEKSRDSFPVYNTYPDNIEKQSTLFINEQSKLAYYIGQYNSPGLFQNQGLNISDKLRYYFSLNSWSMTSNLTNILKGNIFIIPLYGSISPYDWYIDFPFYSYDSQNNLLISHNPVDFEILANHIDNQSKIKDEFCFSNADTAFVYNSLQDLKGIPNTQSGWMFANMTDQNNPEVSGIRVFVLDRSVSNTKLDLNTYISEAINKFGSILDINFGYVEDFHFFSSKNVLIGFNGSLIWSSPYNNSYFKPSNSYSLLFEPLNNSLLPSEELKWYIDPLLEEIYVLTVTSKQLFMYDFNSSVFKLVDNLSDKLFIPNNEYLDSFAYNNETGKFLVLKRDKELFDLSLDILQLTDDSIQTIKFGEWKEIVPSGLILDSEIKKAFLPINHYGLFIYDLLANSSLLIEESVLSEAFSPLDYFLIIIILGSIVFSLFVFLIVILIVKFKSKK